MEHKVTLFSSIAAILLAAGCAKAPAAPPPATAQAAKPPVAAPRPVAEAPAEPLTLKNLSASLNVGDDIIRACGLHFDEVTAAPKFEYDDSDLLPQDKAVLDQIAACLTTGPLAGRRVSLVGRTDPRGTVEYNFVLGAHRAHTVSAYLESAGVESTRVHETSRGELDSGGSSDAGWSEDRRVDIVLAG